MSTKEEKKSDQKPSQRKKTHKYSELDGEDIDEATVKEVLGKTTNKSNQRHAFDGI